ncbi:MAG TPA: M12 family metallopeptidase, partial [Verrucomicrobiae bacterium]
EQQTYLDGLREWELAANVKFVPHTNQANWILFSYNTNFQDYVAGGSYSLQMVTVASLSRAQVCHEMGHSFGFTHENIRPDATNYILVLTNNISNESTNIYWFTIDPTSVTNGHYDYESVMHLGWDFDSTNPGVLATQQPKPPNFPRYQYRMGNYCLSPGDRAALAYLYGPPAVPLTNVVTTTADVGLGSLRAALYYVTDHPGSLVKFNIPVSDPGYSNSVYNIHLTGMLPPLVSNGMVIDGSTQPGFTGKPLIIVDGSQIIPETYTSDTALLVYSSSNQVKDISFSGFVWNGLTFTYADATNNSVSGCWIGVDSTGTNPAPNAYQGILVTSSSGHNTFAQNLISGNSQYGIYIGGTNTGGNLIEYNHIGTDATGSNVVPNQLSGILIGDGSSGNTVSDNVLSGNSQYGIYIAGTNTEENVVQGNDIGTDPSGSFAMPNGLSGVFLGGTTTSNIIGGANAAARNILSGNDQYGVWISDTNTTGNLVEGNYIGTDVTGTNAIPNQFSGIILGGWSSGNTIFGNLLSGNEGYGVLMTNTIDNLIWGNGIGLSGSEALGNTLSGIGIFSGAQGNVIGPINIISGNAQYGIEIGGPNTANNVVSGNYIGTDATGTNSPGVQPIGVGIVGGAAGNIIGGLAVAARNVISGNTTYGVYVSDSGTSGNTVEGNLIGTDVSGTRALPNGGWGIGIWSGASFNYIGGVMTGARNVISGSTGAGYGIAIGTANSNVVEGNFIGTDISGKLPVPNNFAGVAVESGSVGNLIGGTAAGAGNVIDYNYIGVAVYQSNTTNNAIRGNSIFDSGWLAIDLDGFPGNHVGFEAGPDDWQNYPVITNAFGYGGSTIVRGNFNSLPNQSYYLDFYASPSETYYSQGQDYIGTVSVTTSGAGNALFACTNTSANDSGQYITAIATAYTGDSSEFSAEVLATNEPAPSAQFGAPFRWVASGFVFNLTFATNFSYHIQATTNLAANPVPWVNLTNFTATNISMTFTDRAATSYRARFYRVISP